MPNLDEIKVRRERINGASWKAVEGNSNDIRSSVFAGNDLLATLSSWKRHEYADFIANAPTDIDWLIAEVERLREERKKLQENPMTRLTDERIAEIEAKLSSYDFKDSLGHPLTNCKDFQYLLAEMKVLKAEKAQAEAERDVLADACARIVGSPDGQEFPPLVHKGNITKWLNYAQQQAEKQGEQE